MISKRTAELALIALGAAYRLASPKRNGRAAPEDWKTAFRELARISADAGTDLGDAGSGVTRSQVIRPRPQTG